VALQPLNIDYKTFLKQNFVLPPLPGTVTKVLEAVNSPTVGAKEVAEQISLDGAMTSHVLKVVNSAYYGLPKAIGDLRYAIAYLGLGEISRIALTLSVINVLKPTDVSELKRYFLHSYLTAISAKHLLKRLKNVFDISDLYSAALLHDVGKLVYQRFFPEHYRVMSKYCLENGRMFVDAETHFDMPSHLTFGSLLCDHWNLPRSIKRACEFHELDHLKSIDDPSKADGVDIAVAASNMLSLLSAEPLESSLKEEIAAELKRVLVLSDEDFLLLMADIYDLQLKAQEMLKDLM
jgi:HD-like signal output (HDOD) protein